MAGNLTIDEAVSALDGDDTVHCYLDVGMALIGADWSRKEVLEFLAGADWITIGAGMCRGMNHAVIARNDGKVRLFASKADRLAEIEQMRKGA